MSHDFLSEGGKVFDSIRDTPDSVGIFDNLRELLPATRSAGLRIFILPHRHYQEGDFDLTPWTAGGYR